MKSKGRYGQFVRWIFSCIDLLIVNLTYLAIMLWDGASQSPHDTMFSRPVWLVLNVAMLVCIYFYNDVHERRVFYAEKVVGQALKLVLTHAGIFVTLTTFLGPTDVYWQHLLLFYVLFFLVLATWWVLSRQFVKLYRNRGFNFKRVIVIGGGTVGVRLIDEMLGDQGYGYHIVGFFDNNPRAKSASAAYQGTLDDVEQFVKTHQVDEMFCAVPDVEDNHNVSRMIRIADNNAVDFYYVPQFGRTVTRQFELQSVGDVPILAVHPYPLKNPLNRLIKRAFDLLVSTIALILSPLIIIPVAIGIKLSSPGPIFFVQKRTGYRGQAFNCYKFRTMRVNADSDTLQATKGDPRVTKFGTFLRRSSIDESSSPWREHRADQPSGRTWTTMRRPHSRQYRGASSPARAEWLRGRSSPAARCAPVKGSYSGGSPNSVARSSSVESGFVPRRGTVEVIATPSRSGP